MEKPLSVFRCYARKKQPFLLELGMRPMLFERRRLNVITEEAL